MPHQASPIHTDKMRVFDSVAFQLMLWIVIKLMDIVRYLRVISAPLQETMDTGFGNFKFTLN